MWFLVCGEPGAGFGDVEKAVYEDRAEAARVQWAGVALLCDGGLYLLLQVPDKRLLWLVGRRRFSLLGRVLSEAHELPRNVKMASAWEQWLRAPGDNLAGRVQNRLFDLSSFMKENC
jgi:hypothetical protein